MRRIIFFIILNVCFTSTVFAKNQLVFALDIIRHGDRTPIVNIPKAPYAWPQGIGQLTERGMSQEYQLGMKLRSRYVMQFHLLPERYQSADIYVRSSDFDRTLMSAESFLFGFYPIPTGAPSLNGYQPVPIHTVPQDKDHLFVVDSPLLNKLRDQYVNALPEWKAKQERLQPKIQRWRDVTGFKIKGWQSFVVLADTLYIYQRYQVPLPVGLSEEDVKEIMETGLWAFAISFKSEVVGKTAGGPLLKEILSKLKDATQHRSPLKFVLYAAHDSTLLSVMSALGAPLSAAPPYASDLSMLLFVNEKNVYTVQVFFNDKPVFIPACRSTICSLAQFTKLAS